MPAKKGKKIKRKDGDGGDGGGGERKRKRVETWNSYIHKVLKSEHDKIGMSAKAMSIVNTFVNDILDRICTEASRLVKVSKKGRMTQKSVEMAVRLVVPGELCKTALEEGHKAVAKYKASNNKSDGGKKATRAKASKPTRKSTKKIPVSQITPAPELASQVPAGTTAAAGFGATRQRRL